MFRSLPSSDFVAFLCRKNIFQKLQNKQKVIVKSKKNQQHQSDYFRGQIKRLINDWFQLQSMGKSDSLKEDLSQKYDIQNAQFGSAYGEKEKQGQEEKIRQIVQLLHFCHPFFRKINFFLTETLISIGQFQIYNPGQSLKHIFFNQKLKLKCERSRKLGIILYGKVKIYKTVPKFQVILNEKGILGEHSIDCLHLDSFFSYQSYNVTIIEEQTCILWIKAAHFQLFEEEALKSGLKEELRRMQALIKINWVRKGLEPS